VNLKKVKIRKIRILNLCSGRETISLFVEKLDTFKLINALNQ